MLNLKNISRNALVFNFCLKSSRKYSNNVNTSFKEVIIPVPWGHLAGKWWGPTDKRPILTVHGWQENCASFDRLIPLLDKNVSFLCIDLPGHGLSSRIPSGVSYNFAINCMAIRSVLEHYKCSKVSFMAHSWGGFICYSYGLLFPEDVDFSIFIDGFYPKDRIRESEKWKTVYNNFFKYDKQERDQREPPSYNMEEIRQRVCATLDNSIHYEHSLLMAARNIAPSKIYPDKYYFTRDRRLKVAQYFYFSDQNVLELSQELKFPFLLLRSKSSALSGLTDEQWEVWLDFFTKNNHQFNYHYIDGNHHVHLNEPEKVAGLINDFIRKNRVVSS